jgi:glucan 1,3-beta-glucosidase
MLFSSLLAAALAAAPLAVSAGGTLGFALGNTLSDGSTCKQQSDYEADLQAIKSASGSTLVRTYSDTNAAGVSCDTAGQILPAAQSQGFQVVLGMWPDGGAYEKEKQALLDANLTNYQDVVYGITVGSEGIYRGTYQESDLVGWISEINGLFSSFKIGTADSWNSWQNGSMDGVISSSSLDLA